MTESTNKLIEQVAKYMEATGDFILEQAPEVIQQIIVWDMIKYFTIAIATLAIFVTCACFFKTSLKWARGSDDDFAYLPPTIFGIVSLFCLITFVQNAMLVAQIKFAPKYYIVQKVLKKDF